MIPHKIIVCGVVKNVEKYIQINIDNCIETGKLFEDYKIIIYENNSTDNTKNILSKYVDSKIRTFKISAPFSKIFNHACRAGKDDFQISKIFYKSWIKKGLHPLIANTID